MRSIKKLETSPTNRYYGLPVEDAPTTTHARRAGGAGAGGGGPGGPGERGGWTSRRGYGREAEEGEGKAAAGGGGGGAVVGGQMGRFQLTSRTGLGGRDEVSFFRFGYRFSVFGLEMGSSWVGLVWQAYGMADSWEGVRVCWRGFVDSEAWCTEWRSPGRGSLWCG